MEEKPENTSETPSQDSSPQSVSGQESSENPQVALEKRIAELEAQVKERDQKYVYLYADFENFKKRAIKERSDAMKYGWENVARDMLQVVDNLERALAHMPATTDQGLADGLKMVIHQFKNTMEKQGVQQINALNQPFDPNLHEAVGQTPSEEHAAGVIVHEQQPGYTLHGRLLRPSRVILSAGK